MAARSAWTQLGATRTLVDSLKFAMTVMRPSATVISLRSSAMLPAAGRLNWKRSALRDMCVVVLRHKAGQGNTATGQAVSGRNALRRKRGHCDYDPKINIPVILLAKRNKSYITRGG